MVLALPGRLFPPSAINPLRCLSAARRVAITAAFAVLFLLAATAHLAQRHCQSIATIVLFYSSPISITQNSVNHNE